MSRQFHPEEDLTRTSEANITKTEVPGQIPSSEKGIIKVKPRRNEITLKSFQCNERTIILLGCPLKQCQETLIIMIMNSSQRIRERDSQRSQYPVHPNTDSDTRIGYTTCERHSECRFDDVEVQSWSVPLRGRERRRRVERTSFEGFGRFSFLLVLLLLKALLLDLS